MPRPRNSDERRAQITRGLMAVMAKHGYEGASIADVAKHAGLTPGLVHYHFKNKLEILVEVVRALAADHLAAVDLALAQAHNPRAQVEAFIHVHLGTGQHANPEALACWVLVTAEAVRDRRVQREVATVLGQLAERLVAILERGVAERRFGCSDPRAAAAAVLATVQGYFVLSATAREIIPAGSAAASALAMTDGFLRPRGGRS